MDLEDDVPSLVEANAPKTIELPKDADVKVPITLVTGWFTPEDVKSGRL